MTRDICVGRIFSLLLLVLLSLLPVADFFLCTRTCFVIFWGLRVFVSVSFVFCFFALCSFRGRVRAWNKKDDRIVLCAFCRRILTSCMLLVIICLISTPFVSDNYFFLSRIVWHSFIKDENMMIVQCLCFCFTFILIEITSSIIWNFIILTAFRNYFDIPIIRII